MWGVGQRGNSTALLRVRQLGLGCSTEILALGDRWAWNVWPGIGGASLSGIPVANQLDAWIFDCRAVGGLG